MPQRKGTPAVPPYIHLQSVLTSGVPDRLSGALALFRCKSSRSAGDFKIGGATNAVFGFDLMHMRCRDATRLSGSRTFQPLKFNRAPDGLPELKGQCVRDRAGEIVR